ncbi:MAG: LysR family transcriptional regulator [Bacteriovoracaceae bacterium]|nr:LysR family transcriptional regulator [Bacteriovoracaceae bacterium]
MINNIDLFKIKIIRAVSDCQGVTEAAKHLKITPSAISQCIKSLEKNLKTQLFIRVGKKLKPTPFTKKLCELSVGFFDSIENLLSSQLGTNFPAVIRIGAPAAFGSNWLVPKIAKFLQQFPSLKIKLNLLDTNRLISDLIEYKFDMVFVDGGSHLSDFKQISYFSVFEELLIMCASQKFYKENFKDHFDYKQLHQLNHIPYHDGKEAIYKWYHYHFGKVSTYQYSLCVDTAEGVFKAIKNNLGIGVIPFTMVEKELEEKKLVVIKKKTKPLTSQIVLCQLNEKIPSKMEKDFIKFITL